MRKRSFVISDIEMGKGDLMDDFSDDELLVRFIASLADAAFEGETWLFLNGDIFDFLKMDFQGEYTRYITEEISLWKLEQILRVHPRVFEALAGFLRDPGHHLFFVIGNHDFDLAWPKIQARVRNFLGQGASDMHGSGISRVHFGHLFDEGDLHIQHGNLVDPFFAFDTAKPFISFRGQQILNLPIGCQISFFYLVPFKKKFAKEEQLSPRGEAIRRFPEYRRAIAKMKWLSSWKVIWDRFLHADDPTYRINYRAFLSHFLEFGLDFINDEKFLPSRIKKLAKMYKQPKVFVLGHSHCFSKFELDGRKFLVTDTWRDEYSFSSVGRQKKPKTFAEIQQEGSKISRADVKIYER